MKSIARLLLVVAFSINLLPAQTPADEPAGPNYRTPSAFSQGTAYAAEPATGVPFAVAGGGGAYGSGFGFDTRGELQVFPMRSLEPLLVVSDEAWPKDKLAEAREDGAIMMRLLQDALRQSRTPLPGETLVMGIQVNELGAGRPPRVQYLEGFGVLFQLNTSLPLVAPVEPEEPEMTKVKTNSDWERARREVYGRTLHAAPSRPGRETNFDPEAVNRLKSALIDALGNAGNLRHVADHEQIVVTVRGPGPVRRMGELVFENGAMMPVDRRVTVDDVGGLGFNWVGNHPAPEHESTMTLKVKKEDAEALTSGRISREEFRDRVRTTEY